jgi:hypothetical protein
MEEALRQSGTKRVLTKASHILAILFFAYIFGYSMNFSLNDPDIWWHLKTGQYIVNNWEVPDVDPFAFTTPHPLSEGQKIGLRAHWLGQVIFYSAYVVYGYAGVVILRNILIVLPMIALYLWLSKKGIKPWIALIVSGFPALMLSIQLFYAFERPQGISFFLSLVVIMLLEKMRERLKELKVAGSVVRLKALGAPLFLPLVTALWANMHAGFIVGDVIIILYVAGEAAGALWRRLRGSKEAGTFREFSSFALLSVLCSFVNPNTYRIFYSYLYGLAGLFYKSVSSPFSEGGWVEGVVLEYKPLYYFYKELHYEWLVFFWIFTCVLVILLAVKYWLNRRIDITELLVVGFIIFFGNYYARGLMFSLVIFGFYAGKSIVEINRPGKIFRYFSTLFVSLLLTVSIGFVTYTARTMPYAFKPGVADTWVTPWYPVGAAQFIKENRVQGPMYNFYTWGGFLIWTLYPDYQVFIDGRALDDMVNRAADSILKTFPGWRSTLDAFNINFIVVPLIFRESGHLIPLTTTLAYDGDWTLIYIANNSAVFVRNRPENAGLIAKFQIDKKKIFTDIIDVEDILLLYAPGNPTYNLGKAEALYSLGRYKEAKAIFERFPAESAPMLRKLKEMGY